MVIIMKNSLVSAENFMNLLLNGKIRKNILPNTAVDYTESAEKRDLLRYKKFINSSAYDEIKRCEVKKYNGDD